MNKKVEILIEDKDVEGKPLVYTYTGADGKTFVSVSYNSNTYGAASPCNTEEDVIHAIECAKETITKAQDKFTIIDKRVKQNEST